MRNQLLEDLHPLLAELISKAKDGRFRGDKDTYKLRVSYINALANLLRAYNQLSRDKEIDELMEEIEKLKANMNRR